MFLSLHLEKLKLLLNLDHVHFVGVKKVVLVLAENANKLLVVGIESAFDLIERFSQVLDVAVDLHDDRVVVFYVFYLTREVLDELIEDCAKSVEVSY